VAFSTFEHANAVTSDAFWVQAGIEKCSRLRVLYMSNNKLKDWTELDRLSALQGLEELLLIGNPIYNEFKDNNALPQYRIEVRQG